MLQKCGHAKAVVQREKKDLNHVEKLITNPGTHTWPDILQSESAASPLKKKHGISRGKEYHRVASRVSVQGVESLWGDCRFIPADGGSQ